MSEYAIETFSLCKRYNKLLALNDVSLRVRKGSITGLVGKNGAGKTTLIRVLTDVAKPTSGSFTMLGATSQKDLMQVRRRVAAMVETPALYTNMTARNNLKAKLILMDNKVDNIDEFIDAQLDFVGLGQLKKSNKIAKDFSLGMRQRLGIAMAIIGDPELLILDEPTNGLDPEGIREIRELLIKLNKERGITIIISSHILSELSKLATEYIFLNKGKVIREISEEELENSSGRRILLQVDDPVKCRKVLDKLGLDYKEIGDSFSISGYEESGLLVTSIVKGGVSIKKLHENNEDLEDYFLTLLGEEKHG